MSRDWIYLKKQRHVHEHTEIHAHPGLFAKAGKGWKSPAERNSVVPVRGCLESVLGSEGWSE